ncbi:MAG: site-2 protease family protein [Longimicrobiales bacterium]
MEALLLLPVLLLSFVVHEFAHAWVAWREGDATAYRQGRVTLNPVPHIDLFGTILIPLMLLVSGSGFLIGWAKPVPVDNAQLRRGRRSRVLVSAAGVTANLLLAAVLTVLVVGAHHLAVALPGTASAAEVIRAMATVGIRLNFVLLVFNLLPVPPLDGSHLLAEVLPARWQVHYQRLERWGIAVFVLLLLTGAISVLLQPAFFLEKLSWTVIAWWT